MKYASAALELAGMAAIGCGAYQLAPWLGWVVAGGLALIVGQSIGGSAS